MSHENWKIKKSELNSVWTDEEIKHLKDMEETKNTISVSDYEREEDYLNALKIIEQEIEEYTKELNIKYDELAKKNLNEYSQVAEWCNNTREYHIEEVGDEYCVVKNPEPLPPTTEEISKIREQAYIIEVDVLHAKKQRKTILGTWTEEDEAEYIAEVKARSEDIANRYPYPEEVVVSNLETVEQNTGLSWKNE